MGDTCVVRSCQRQGQGPRPSPRARPRPRPKRCGNSIGRAEPKGKARAKKGTPCALHRNAIMKESFNVCSKATAKAKGKARGPRAPAKAKPKARLMTSRLLEEPIFTLFIKERK